jgi:hypothetical protein
LMAGIFWMVLGSLSPALAGDLAPGEYHLSATQGEVEKFKVEFNQISDQIRQVTWWHLEERNLAPDTRTPVLFGRDLDGDKNPDAWFYRNEDGVFRWEDAPSKRRDGWDIAQKILEREIRLSNRWLIAVGLNAVFSQLSFTVAQMNALDQTVLTEELDIHTLELLRDRIRRDDPLHPYIKPIEQTIARAYKDILARLENEETNKLFLALAGDAALLFLTGGSAKIILKVEAWAMSKLGTTTAVQTAKAAFTRYTGAMTARASRYALTTAAITAARAEPHILAALAPMQALRTAITAVVSKAGFGSAASKALTAASGITRAALSQWKYVALSQSLQIAAEAMARGEEIYDPNPIVMTKRLFSNEEFIQNFLYMGNETFWMAGLSTYFETPGKRILSCALFSLVDSAVVNYAIKGSVDPERQAFDTGWEVIVGTGQVQLDMAAMRALDASAQRTGNPRLKLLGYLVVVADQGAGYYIYSRATSLLEQNSNGDSEAVDPTQVETILIPVMGPT